MALGHPGKRIEGPEEEASLVAFFTNPSIARQNVLLGKASIPAYANKCSVMVEMGWTEQQYFEENSELGLAELGIYLSARAKANQPKGKRPAKKPPRGQSPGYKPPKRRL